MKKSFLSNKNNNTQNSTKKIKTVNSITLGKILQKKNNAALNSSRKSVFSINKNNNNINNKFFFIDSNKTSGKSIFSKNTSSTTLFTLKNFELNNSEKNLTPKNHKVNESLEKNNSKNDILKIIHKKEDKKILNNKTKNFENKIDSNSLNFNSNKKYFSNRNIIHLRSKSLGMESSESSSEINLINFSSFDLTPLPQFDEEKNKSTFYGAKYLRRLEYDIQINKGFRHLLRRKNFNKNKKLSKYYSYLKKFVQITRNLSKRKGGIGEKIIFLRFIFRLYFECYKLHFHHFISIIKKIIDAQKKKKKLKSKKKNNNNINNNNIICLENKFDILKNKNKTFSIEKNNSFLFKKFIKTFQISKNNDINIIKKKRLFDIEKETEFELINNNFSKNYFDNFIKHLSNIFGENINLSGMRNFPRPICEEGINKKILKKTYFKRIYKLEHKLKFKDSYYNEVNSSKHNSKINLELFKSNSYDHNLDEINQKNEDQIFLIDKNIKNKFININIKTENNHIKLIKKKVKNNLNFITKIIIKNDQSKINNNLHNSNHKKIKNKRLIIDLIIVFINNFWINKIKKNFFELFLNDYYYPFKRKKNDFNRLSSKCELMDEDEEKLNKLNLYFSSKKYENNMYKK